MGRMCRPLAGMCAKCLPQVNRQRACCWLPLGILYFCIYTFCIGVFCIYVLYREWAIFSWIVASSCRSGRIFDIWISGQILTGRRGGGCFPEILNSLFSLRKNLNSQSSIPSSQKLSIPCIMTSIIKSSIIKIEASGFNHWTAGQLQCLLDRGGKFQNKRKENTSSFYRKVGNCLSKIFQYLGKCWGEILNPVFSLHKHFNICQLQFPTAAAQHLLKSNQYYRRGFKIVQWKELGRLRLNKIS